MLVAIEGCDAAGKATQSKILAERMSGELFSFPDYSTPSGKAILSHLKEEWACRRTAYGEHFVDPCDALVFQSLMTINRYEAAPRIIDAVRRQKPVVCDRFYASSIVYGEASGLDCAWVEKISANLPQPDLWIFLDVSPEESVRRRPERRDRHERQEGLMDKVRVGYHKLFNDKATTKKIGKDRWVIVDGSGTVDDVHSRIWENAWF